MKHLALSDDARAVLRNASVTADRLVLPPGQLDRATYAAIDKILQSFGGKWSRKERAHLFAADPRAQIKKLVDGEKVVDQRKSLGFFPTPDDVADQLAVLADLKPSMSVLEPSAGSCALILAALRRAGALNVVAIEIDEDHLETLCNLFGHARVSGLPGALFGYALGADFLSLSPDNLFGGPFDRVLMTPPFLAGKDVDHVLHAWKFVRPGGLLCAITSPSWRFRQGEKFDAFRALHEAYGEAEIDVPAGAFKESGTSIATVMVRWRKAAA